MGSSSTPKPAGARVEIGRDMANDRLIDRMMLILASIVLALVLVTSSIFEFADRVHLAPYFYLTSAGYLAVTLGAGWLAPRLATPQQLERLRWFALATGAAAMLSLSYYLGGANWLGAQPLFFLVFGCTFIPNYWRASGIAAVGILGFAGIATLQGMEVLPTQHPLDGSILPLGGGQLAATVVYTSISLTLFFVMSGVISLFLTLQRDALSTTTRELEDSRRELEDGNARLEERVAEKTRELEDRYRELHVMSEIGKIVNQSLDIDNVYLAFIDEVRKLLPFDQASIAVISADRERVTLLRGLIEHGSISGTTFEMPAAQSLSVAGSARIFTDFAAEDEAWIEREYLLATGAVCGASVPILSHDLQVGSFNVVANTAGTYSDAHLRLMERIVEPLALAMVNARLYDEMRAVADTDGLTRLPNRRSLERTLEHEIARSVRVAGRCSVLVMDIDNFKALNDSLGHQAGDELLIQFADMLRETVRETDVVGRQSGDEFTVVLPDTRSEDAFALAQRIHETMKQRDWKYPGEQSAAITTSIGVATYPYDGEDSEALLSRADSAMYVAKAAGGGQTRLSSDVVDSDQTTGRRQVRFALVEALAGAAAERMSGGDAHLRTLTAFTARAAIQIAEQLHLDEAEQRSLRVAAVSHALSIFPKDDPYGEENGFGLDTSLDDIYLKLGRLFVAASPGLDETLHIVHLHHRASIELGEAGDTRLARVLAVAEAYARLTLPGAEPQLTPAQAIDTLAANPMLDQVIVATLSAALHAEAPTRAA